MKESKFWAKFEDRFPRFSGWLDRRYRKRGRTFALFMVMAHVVGALTSVQAIMETRTSQGAVAWAISLNAIPVVAVPAYWVFGRSAFQGYVMERRTELAKVQPAWRDTLDKLIERDLITEPGRDEPFLVEKLAKLPVTRGNDAELLIDGDATFASIFEGISRAEDYVLVQFYIIRDDDVGRELKDRLLERAGEGVRCYVLYDEVGSRLPKAYLSELRSGGVEIMPFNTTQGSANRFQLNFRNHRKIVVVDGREAWVGGLNVGIEYKGLDPEFGYWRDTHVRLQGPVVTCVQVPFVEDWQWAAHRLLDGLNWEPRPSLTGASRDVLCLPTGPADRTETCTLFFLHAINAAEKRLWIASPYFVPDEQFISALELAALRGVDVKILIPDESDSVLVGLSAWSYLEELEEAGIEVYRYTKGFMHHKVMLIDDEYCTVGTANFDNRSFRLNFEITMGFRDEDLTNQVEAMLEDDFANARISTAQEIRDRSFGFRFATRVARLMAPVQ